MKTRAALFAALCLVTFGFACNQAANDNTRTGMNHNTNMPMNHNGMSTNEMDHSMMQSSPNAATAPYDLQFLDTMIAHHRGAVDMAGPCAAKAQHSEVKTLCSNIISSQEKEIAEMKAWRDKWFPGAAPALNMEMAGMSGSMMGMDMKKLGSLSGNDFDLEFIREMIPHHEGAVTMAKEALQKSTKGEIKTLANAIIKAQEAEIKQMKEWQTAWAK
jgi:uncharacterized protein (DUF305 family)